MKTSKELIRELEISSEAGFETLQLLQYIENLITTLGKHRQGDYGQNDKTNLEMIDHVEKMFEERLTDLLIEKYNTGKDPDSLEQYLYDNIGCGFANFISRQKKRKKQ